MLLDCRFRLVALRLGFHIMLSYGAFISLTRHLARDSSIGFIAFKEALRSSLWLGLPRNLAAISISTFRQRDGNYARQRWYFT